MNEYFNPDGIDRLVLALGSVVGLLVMVGVSYIGGGVVAIVAGVLAFTLTYGNRSRPDHKRGTP